MIDHYPKFRFEIVAQDANTPARTGLLVTPHGEVQTPNFIFCATKAALKGASPENLERVQAEIILSNTYHLFLNPGAELIEKLGGLHAFMGWRGPMLTDSGGFQIFSLGHGSVADEIKGRRSQGRNRTLQRITEEGAVFKSYLDGSMHTLTPEKSIAVQRKLGADLIVVLDECTPYHVVKEYTADSMRLSHRWGLRCVEEFQRTNDGRQALVGIVQGGVYADLRRESADFVSSQPFFGHAIGGSLGATKAQMYEVVSYAMAGLRKDRPVHLLGIGDVDDIWENVGQGIDLFDCVSPTRIARHGTALLRRAHGQKINLLNAKFRYDDTAVDAECDCYTCKRFSRAYLHYLFKAKELLGIHLLVIHNMRFMMRLLATIREAIRERRLLQAKQEWYDLS